MPTIYPSEQEISDAVTQWVHEQVIEARAGKLISFHINQIVPTLPFAEGSRQVFDTSLVMFNIAKNVLREHYAYEPRYLLLAIPLAYSKKGKIQKCPQTLKKLVKQLYISPPSLYFIYPYHYSGAYEAEEYRAPLPFAIQEPDPFLDVYYLEQRDKQDIENNWEFHRTVYAQYWIGPAQK